MPTLFTASTNDIIATIEVDQKTGEYHASSAKVTQFATETGALINDHIITQPQQLTIAFVIENTQNSERAANSYQALKKIQQQRQLVDVLTQHELYKNMAINSITAENTGPFTGRLVGRITLQHYQTINIQQVKVPKAQLKGDAKLSATSPVDGGRQQGTPVDKKHLTSFAKQISNLFWKIIRS